MPTYKLTHRPEGWVAHFNILERCINTAPAETEREAIRRLNEELALHGLHRFYLTGEGKS